MACTTPHPAAAAVLLGALLGAGGCDSRPDDGTEPGTGASRLGANGEVVGGPPGLGAALPEALAFELFADAAEVPTGAEATVALTATLLDEDRAPVAAEAVTWRADAGFLQDVVAETDENGTATATLLLPASSANGEAGITVSARDGAEARIAVAVAGTELAVEGFRRSVVAGESIEATLSLVDGTGAPVAGEALSVGSAAGNLVSPAAPVTDANGRASVSIGSAEGDDTIVFGVAGDPSLAVERAFAVSADRLEFDAGPDGARFEVGTVGRVTVRWTRGGAPVAFTDLRVSASAGRLLSGSTLTTDANGEIVVPIRSAAAGPATLAVEDLDGDPADGLDLAFVAGAPARLDLDAADTRVHAGGTAALVAFVRDAGGNPVAGEEVVFSSPDLAGGRLVPAAAVTDEDGRARATFEAGSLATGEDAIAVTARAAAVPTVAAEARLSVVERRLNVSIGRGAGLFEDDLATRNWRRMVVQVADGSGAAVAGAEVSLSIVPIGYLKGALVEVDADGRTEGELGPGDGAFEAERYERPASAAYCDAEDDNGNRALDPGEDDNGNGRLDPPDPAVLAPLDDPGERATIGAGGTLVTGADGSGHFRLVYPKGNATWARVRVTARASHEGAEARDGLESWLAALREDLLAENGEPPNLASPYGVLADCAATD